MHIQGLNHLCFSVSDLEKSITFNRDVFGARLLVRGRKLAYFDLAGLWLALNVEEEVDRSGARSTYTHIAFTVREDDFDGLAARLRELGVETLPGRERDERDQRSVYFRDPDGHTFEFHTGALRDRLDYYRDEKKHMQFTLEEAPPPPSSDDLRIDELRAIESRDAAGLRRLLIDDVEDGASIGFLPPLSEAEAERYWSGVGGEDVVLWVARQGDDIVGTVQLHLCGKPNGAHRAEIAKLMVSPLARRRGIARSLMEAAEARARAEGRSLLVLDTREGDPSNVLYASLGYIRAGRIPSFARSANGALDATIIYYKALDLDVT